MKRNIAMVIFTFIVSLSLGVAQEQPAPVSYDLPAVIARVLKANPTIHATEHGVGTAQAQVEEARTGLRPRIQGEAGYLQLDKDPSFSVQPFGTLVFGRTNNPWASVSMDWPIYNGDLSRGMIAASRQGVDAAWQGYARTRQEIVAEAATSYYQVLSAQRMVEVMKTQIVSLTEAVRVATGLHDQGMVAKLDVLRPSSDLASAQTALIQAENGSQLALANLKRLLNLPRTTVITVTPAAESGVANSAALPTGSDSITTATQTALTQRPEMKQLQANLRAMEAQRMIVRAGHQPELALHAQYDLERPTTYPEIGVWSVAVVLRQPLYDGGTAHAKLAEVNSQRQELTDREEALTQGIAMQVTDAVLNMQAAAAKVRSATQANTTAEEAYRAAQMSYQNQVLPVIDLISAQTVRTNARVQLTLAEFDRQIAHIQYHLALGDAPDPAITSLENHITQDAKL